MKEIEEVYLNDDFQYVKSKKTFKKKDGKNELTVRYQFYSGLSTHCTYGMVLSTVEELKKKAWGSLYRKDHSIVNNRCDLPGNIDPKYSYLLVGDDERDTVKRVLDAIANEKKMYLEFGKDFFNKYQDLKAIDQFYNVGDSKDSSGDLVMSDSRYMALSIISAAVVQNPSRFQIYQKQRDFIASRPHNDHYRLLEKYFDPLIKTLKQIYN